MPHASRQIRFSTALGAALLSGSLLAAGAAHATGTSPEPAVAEAPGVTPPGMQGGTTAAPYAKVTAHSGLNVRHYPSTDSSVRGVLKYQQKVYLDCKVRAQYVAGNTIWYKLQRAEKWISARYADNYGTVPLCKHKFPTRLNNSPISKHAKG